MKILALRRGLVEAPLVRPFRTALRETSSIRSVVVRLETDAGIGWGAASGTPAITGDTEDAVVADLARAATALAGRAWDHPAEALAALPPGTVATASALAALDIALHDAWAATDGRPLADALAAPGTTPAARATTDTTISLDAPDVMAGEAADAAARGFDVLKVKVGTDAAGDLARLRAVRDAAPDAALRVDANQAWTPDEAVRAIRAMEDAGLRPELVEQPVARHDLAGLARVTAAVDTPILADEVVFTPADAERVIGEHAADMLNVKLMKSGGLLGAGRILDLAARADLPCMVGAMMESTIGIAAALALACAHESVTMIDLDPPLLTASEPVVGGLTIEGAALVRAQAPGLGITDVKGTTWLD